ncbi:MAG: hypothetical protein ACRCT8_16615 [Lacipirellulaceae bacterium]
MSKHLLAAAAAAALFFVVGTERASAQGVHFSSGRVHVDVGNPHGHGYGFHRSPAYGRRVVVGYPGYGGGYGSPYGHRRVVGYGGHGHHGRSVWHDTSHYDWHGPSLQPHGNHFDYVPGHYDFHRDGHWDHH